MKDRLNDISGRPTALVTGGSRGIGFELAKQFARHGHDLVLVARDAAALERAAFSLRNDCSCAVTTISLDLDVHDAPERLMRELRSRALPAVDVLVNAAGIGDYGPFAESPPDQVARMVRLNVLGLTMLTRLLLPGMIEGGRGRILNVASLVAYFVAGPRWSVYVASKHYVLSFTKCLRQELRGTGVTVTALCPGATATEFVGRSGVGATLAYRFLPQSSPAAVAAAGYRATMAGRATVVPGLVNKIFAFLGELPPRAIGQAVFAFLIRGNAANN